MTRLLLAVVALAVGAVASSSGAAAAERPDVGSAAGRAPARLLVTADEWSLVLSRPRLRAGAAIVQLVNRGEDAHDLRLRRVDRTNRYVGRALRVGEARPGALGEADVRLARGAWRLWCSLPGHRQLGMYARLRAY